MEMNAKNIITKAAELLQEKGWSQDAFARNESGDIVCYCDTSAVSFCTIGSLRKAVYVLGGSWFAEPYADARTEVMQEIGMTIPEWNDRDDQTKENVIATLKRVAERL